MSLFKKIVFGIFIIVSAALGVWGYNALKQNKKPSKDILALLPDSCMVYCSTKNYSELSVKLNSQNLIFKSWTVFKDIDQLSKQLNFYDSLIYSNELIKEITSDNTIHFALYPNSVGADWIAAFNLKELKQEKDMIELCSVKLKEKGENFFLIGNGHFLAIEQGAVLISNSEALVKRSLSKGAKLKANRLFAEQLDNVGNSDAMRVYFNHTLFQKGISKPEMKFTELLEAIESVGGVKFSPSEIIINGNYKPNGSLIQKLIAAQEPQFISVYDKIPFGARSFKAISISSSEELKKLLGANEANRTFWKSVNEKALYNASNEFYNSIGSAVAEFSSFSSKAVLIDLKDTSQCMEVISNITDSVIVYENTSLFRLEDERAVEAMLGGVFELNAGFAFVLNSTLYLAENETGAKEICYALLKGASLKNDQKFISYANENMNTNCNLVYYQAPNKNLNELKKFTSLDIEKNKSAYENLTDANIVITKQKGNTKFRMHLNYQSPSNSDIPNLLWQCALDSNATQQPYLFTNHNTQESEILIQDKSDQLYLINSTGSILWKKKINETIRSEIYTVDIFKNKKHQLLFNTDNYLHLIDRNGNYVQGYPIKLPAKASNAISLIDYDGDRNYRVFIACSNNTIYNFNLYGVRSEGYKPYKSDAPVKLPIKFVRVGESDYLLTIDVTGTIHAFSRKGEGRIGFKNKAIENCSDFAVVATNNINSTFLYYIDEKNSLANKISFADKKDAIKLNADLNDAHINFVNVNDDRVPDFVTQSVNGIYVFDVNGSLLYQNAKMAVNSMAHTANMNGKQFYYTVDHNEQKLFITNSLDLGVTQLSSVSEAAVFNLFNDDKKYLLYSNGSKLICNLLK